MRCVEVLRIFEGFVFALRTPPLAPPARGGGYLCAVWGLVVLVLGVLCGAAMAAEVDPVLCRAVGHVPDSDVAYKAGVDVYGKSVVPADLPQEGGVQVPPVRIPLTMGLAKVLNLPADKYPFKDMGRTDINLGTLTLDGDKVLLDGRELTSEQKANMAAGCR